jgi:hypothetical protein
MLVKLAAIDWIRSGHQARAFVYQGEQLEWFEHGIAQIEMSLVFHVP